jgi:hypothetical protein
MEVFHIKGIVHPVLDPESLFCPLAFRAMTVTTTIITYPLLTADIAKIFMPSQSRCATLLQGIKGTYHKTVGLTLLNILLSKPIYDLGNFKLRTLHYF